MYLLTRCTSASIQHVSAQNESLAEVESENMLLPFPEV